MNHESKMDPNLELQIRALIKDQKQVEAIALVQKELKIGLKNSKDLVDEMTKHKNQLQSGVARG